ncbi:lipopolysaccharide transport system permease protein [Mucilaginibacter oryzae]|uniref:Transport permease protein n=1 Tax=Mucilaginibacter oryzae TaxID=468058 RepID=A0A316HH44_9SPHI|nr:ABC transporter permease [Mucilaginibacter oryzae]PWK79856.1 lipopolysaccharide transport system permease protein [Mucilaginibacter oryzae]
MSNTVNEKWDLEINAKSSLFDLKLKELWHYRDLLILLVRRDFVSFYKQTILGPVWFFVQPVVTIAFYTIVFGGLAGIPVDGLPKALFYLAGTIVWNYFSDCLIKTSTVFKDNAAMLGKVYFPRLIMPVSIVLSNLVRFAVQLLLFVVLYLIFLAKGEHIAPNYFALLLPLLILMIASLGLGLGMIISAITTKYRDIAFLVTFGVPLLMYATTVVYPLSVVQTQHAQYAWIIKANPITAVIETFRFGFLGKGTFSWQLLGYSALSTALILVAGTVIFNKVEKAFVDTV